MLAAPTLVALRTWTLRLIPVALLALAGWVLWREFHTLTWDAVKAEILGWGPWRIAAAAFFTLSSYALLSAMEWLGLRWSGARVPFPSTLLVGFCANAFAHTIGFAILIGGAVRARLYARHGVTLVMVAQTSVFCGVSFGFGILALGGLVFLISPDLGGVVQGGAVQAVRAAALLAVLAPIAYVVACLWIKAPLHIAGHTFLLPPPGMAALQMAIGLADNCVTALVVWVLVPDAVSAAGFIAAYVAATVIGLVSSVPGGAGVFEGAMVTLLPTLSHAGLAAAFVGYRLIYFLIPLILAAGLMARAMHWRPGRATA
jgi:uncharacterized membrane protein YbhN (UPF0104 family)